MTHGKSTRSLSPLLLCVGATLTMAMAAGCGVDLRPRTPTFQARAAFVSPAPSYPAAPAQQPSHEAMPAEMATASQYQQSGGATRATAETVAVGSTLIGRVAPGAPRYYALHLAVGDTFEAKAYMRPLATKGATFKFKILEPDDVVLGRLEKFMYRDEWERKSTSITARQAGLHLVKVTSEKWPFDFKVLLNGNVTK